MESSYKPKVGRVRIFNPKDVNGSYYSTSILFGFCPSNIVKEYDEVEISNYRLSKAEFKNLCKWGQNVRVKVKKVIHNRLCLVEFVDWVFISNSIEYDNMWMDKTYLE